ncbi:VCBS repeat-containing protein [Reichenbachiella sp.]|uniref:VCBS repeat-containing protein n=1 Tax=Reichenbachiella sp. TaxID=2184521 RepID=UPI003298BD48
MKPYFTQIWYPSLIKVMFFLTGLAFYSCTSPQTLNTKTSEGDKLFTRLNGQITGVDFSNNIKESLYFNFINYSYIYNGGGVSAGDINNDGLIDIYFTANQTSNKLYLNQGNFKFKDITASAGVEGKLGWTTGTTMIDINNDGYLDIYVSKSGSLKDHKLRENLLFVNQGDETFLEQAGDWRLNDAGFGTQGYFFDYDKDGDLDLYQVNHRADFENNTNLVPEIQSRIIEHFSDQLYENKGDQFLNVTQKAGMANKAWGLSASIGDFNNDGWEDVYVCNDFLQPDYLYINNGDGTFSNKILNQFDHISQNSMGSDFADINNDGMNDLIVAEMSPEDHVRSKSNMPSMSTENFEQIVAVGYHHQYMINTLQLNQGNGSFSDIGQLAGISKTDWSWAPLVADFDEDGWNDLLVTNGIIKDLSNSDYRKKIKDRIASKVKMSLEEAISWIPSERVANYAYRNQGDLTFANQSKTWGLAEASFSNGSTYADLDNDGDLDLIVNNAVDPAAIYKNNSIKKSIVVGLKGPEKNIDGIGARVTVSANGLEQSKNQYLSRGYLSSVTDLLHFGLDTLDNVYLIKVEWPDGRVSEINNPDITSVVFLDYSKSRSPIPTNKAIATSLHPVDLKELNIGFNHQDRPNNDFEKQLLLPYKLSHQGPALAKADVNDDGLEDFYVGGAAGQEGSLYLQSAKGFQLKNGPWSTHKESEDVASVFFDFDGDGDQDLYVVSGSYEFEDGDQRLQDRLYRNTSKGNFEMTYGVLPELKMNGAVVDYSDMDADGDLDLFVGGRVVSGKYPASPKSYLLENRGGKYVDTTTERAPQLSACGMVTDAVFSDFDGDGDEDLIVVGEWAPIQLFENKQGEYEKKTIPKSSGLWFSIKAVDIDRDGDEDYLIGNLGLNSKFSVKEGKEFHIYAKDFDTNGYFDVVLTGKYQNTLVPVRGLECSSEQVPAIKSKFASYQSFATASLQDIYGEKDLQQAFHAQANTLHSVLLRNEGNGNFKIINLPNQAQFAPIMDFAMVDLDHDGNDEVLAVGNLYETEVETVRYDASKGIALSFKNGVFEVIPRSVSGFFTAGNARNIEKIDFGGNSLIIVANNSDKLSAFIR